MSWALTPLTEEQREIQAWRANSPHEIAPYTAQWDRDAYFEPSLVGKLGELGFLGMLIPEKYDGMGLDTLTYLVALEEIATVDASVAVMLSVHNSLPTQMILKLGNRGAEGAFPRADGARRDARRLRALGAGGGIRRGVAPYPGRP